MDSETKTALEAGGLCDMTTIGAKTGHPHRIEMGFSHLDGEFYFTGKPGPPRDWIANMRANPAFTLHLSTGADVSCSATEITDPDERDRMLFKIRTRSWKVDADTVRETNAVWVRSSPLVRFTVDGWDG